MSFNGSGVFVVNSSGQPVVAATLITSAAFNAFTADAATGLSTAILKDGTQTLSADIPFNNKKITGLGAASARTDAASLATIQDGTGVYVATVGGTADAITLTPSPAITGYVAGQLFCWIASGANTTAVTLAVSGLTAKDVKKNGTTALAAGDLPSGALVGARYDGTNFQVVGTGAATHLKLSGGTLSGGLIGTTGTFSGAVTPQALLDVSGASAGQIKFPATQNPSADVQTLDDYEEGTWTPSLGGNTTYTTQTGTYVKVGKLVFVNCVLVVNVLGTGSTSVISGLPFTVALEVGWAVGQTVSLAVSIVSLNPWSSSSGTSLTMYGRTAAATGSSVQAIFGNGATVIITGTYMAQA